MRNGHHPETPPDGSGHTSVALAAEIRRTHTRHLRWLTRKLFSEAGEFQDGLDPVTGLPPWRPPAIEARSVTQRDIEVRVAAGRQPEYGQGEDGDLPAGTTRIRVSVSAHHARTRAPATLGDCEIRAWAVALFDPQWERYVFQQEKMPPGMVATYFLHFLGPDGYPVTIPETSSPGDES